MWCRNNILFLYKSFLNEFIPVFNPNEILILVSCKLKLRSGWKITNLVVWGMWRMSIWSGVKPPKWECLRQSHSFLSCEYRRNFVLDQNTFRNECPIVIVVSYKQPLCEEPFLFPIAVYIAKVARSEKKGNLQVHLQLQFTCLQGTPPSDLLPRITIHNQEKRLWELTKWSLKGKLFDLYKFSWRILWGMYRRSVCRICMLDIGAYRVTIILCCHGDRCGEISMFFSQRKVQYSWLFSNCTCVFKKYFIYFLIT